MICLKHTIKINLVSEFKVTVHRFRHFGSELLKGDFDLGQVDCNNMLIRMKINIGLLMPAGILEVNRHFTHYRGY